MSQNNSQYEPKLPLSNKEKRVSSSLLPRYYRTDSNNKFLQSTIDQLTQPGTVKKLNGYIGRRNAKSVTSKNIFIDGTDNVRESYQLEPSAVIEDFHGNITFYKDYIDHINHIHVFGGDVSKHDRLNEQEFYSWNPHIDWDKFVNYQNYYWLPYGPDPIRISGQQLEIVSTYTVKLVDEGDNYAYLFTPDGLTRNPTLTLYRGQTYRFDISAKGHPFSIKTSRISGALGKYENGISEHSIENGTLIFTVDAKAPNVLYYVSDNSDDVAGVIHVQDVDNNTYLNVDNDIIGKKTYTVSENSSNTQIELSNGMKVYFTGNVYPEKYSTGRWYVEGVGTSIKLISETDLEVSSTYTADYNELFDDSPFDRAPFSSSTSFPRDKDYFVINRSSVDKNPWSRYNRWFHQDIVLKVAEATNTPTNLDQTRRATRPIIEYKAGLKLYNFGHVAKSNVDVIDTFTTDVFSTIEGSIGYNIDGIELYDGMRVLFNADTDPIVKGKIYKVRFVQAPATSLMRSIEFKAATGINLNNNTIKFLAPHNLRTGTQVIYVNNNNESVGGLTNRQVYYVEIIDQFQVRLYNNYSISTGFDSLVSITGLSTGTHQFETFSSFIRQITLVEEADATPILNETVLINYGVANQGLMYWFNGSEWILGQTKTKVNQYPLFDVFDSNENSFADKSIYFGSTFSGTKIFSYKEGSNSADSELGVSLSYKNINNIGDILFNFNLLSDTFTYKQDTTINNQNLSVGYLKVVNSLTDVEYSNGWTIADVKSVQPVVRIYKGTELTNNFPIDMFDDVEQLEDLEVSVYVNNKKLKPISYSIYTGVAQKSVILNSSIGVDDILTIKCITSQAKNNNGYYEFPNNLQNNPLNESVTEFTLGEVIDHVNSIVDNLPSFVGDFPGYSNLRNLGEVSQYGTKFVQHSGPLNLSLYHLGSKEANVFEALMKARDDYGKFKRSFIVAASNSGIEADPKQHVDYILETLVKDKPKSDPYYFSDMFGHAGANILEYTVLDSRTKVYPLTENFNLKSLSDKSVLFYLNGEQLLHGIDYVFGDENFFTILTDLAEDDVITAYEYTSTAGTFCPPTPTKLGLYPKFTPKKYLDNTYLEPTEVIQGHDGSITIAFGDYRDDLILELEKRIYNNLKVEYDPEIFDIFDYVPGYSRPTDYTKEEFEKVLSTYFYQWASLVNKDYTAQTVYDRFNPFTFNYRDNYAPDGTDLPAHWRGIFKWYFDTDRPHISPWEMLGFTEEPTWWSTVYGNAPYTSDNLLLWTDLRQGIIREPGQPVRVAEKFVRPILGDCIPVDDNGDLVDPTNSGMAIGVISLTTGYYIFGDQGPVEDAWRKTSYYPFALLQAALLLKPNKILGTCFDRSRIVLNLVNQYVYKDTNLRLRLKDIILPSTVNDSERVYTSGLVNYIVDYISSDITRKIEQYKDDLQNLTNKLGSKLGGFTSENKFKLVLDSKSPTGSSTVFVPEENYKIAYNVSSPIRKLIYSGIMVTKYPDGFEIRGYNTDNPYFYYHPYLETDRVIRIGGISENFSIWEENKYYVAGKIVRFNNIYYRVKTNHESTTTFNSDNYSKLAELPILGGREAILRKSWDLTITETLSYGTKLATVQEVVDFIQGYDAYLKNQGFIFDEFNASLRAITNWETSIKEFLFWTTQNWSVGSVLSMSPAATKLLLETKYSVVNNVNDPFYKYEIFRVDGQKLEPNFTNILRDDNLFSLVPENTNHGIYGASLYLVQKEHVLIVDNVSMFNDVIYDTTPGYRQEKLKVVGYLSTNWNGGFNVPGFIFDDAKISDWEPWTDYNLGEIVRYKEFYYTSKKFLPGTQDFNNDDWVQQEEKPQSALLPNWDYRAEQFTDFYDLDTDNFDAEQQRMAQHLIGYQKREYLSNIINDSVSQYKFYQGMIIEKGTQNVFNKLFDVLSSSDQESLTFNEEWAVRVGNYGSVDTYDEIEFTLDEAQFKLKPQSVELVTEINPALTDFVYRQTPEQIYIKPVGYNNNPWPTTGTRQYLRTPGYVKYEDVKINIDTLDEILDKDILDFREGDYVWCAFEGIDWNVYRFTKNNFLIENVSYQSGVLTIVCDRIPDVGVNDIIGIVNSPLIEGFHKITNVVNRTITINVVISGWQDFGDSSNVQTYQFVSQRIDSIDNANSLVTNKLKKDELIWTDNKGDGLWGVYKNRSVFASVNIENFDKVITPNFGRKVALTNRGNVAAITDSKYVSLYKKTDNSNEWQRTQFIEVNQELADNDSTDNPYGFGTALSFSADDEWLAIGAPQASNVKYGNIDGINIVSVRGDPSGINNHGYVSIYRKINTNQYTLVKQFTSSTITENSYFGSAISIASINGVQYFAISAPGAKSNKGQVSIYKFSNDVWTIVDEDLLRDDTDNEIDAGIELENDRFGTNLEFSANGEILAVSGIKNTVYIFKRSGSSYTFVEKLSYSDITDFGFSLSVSDTGKYLAVGCPLGRISYAQSGKVFIFELINDQYTLLQELTTPVNETNGQYGHKLKFIGDTTLIVYSLEGDISNLITFDSYTRQLDNYTWVDNFGTSSTSTYVSDINSAEAIPTVFDNDTTRFIDSVLDVGRVDVYDRYNSTFIYGESLQRDANSEIDDLYGFSIAAGRDTILVGAPNDSDEAPKSGSVYSYIRPSKSTSWNLVHYEVPRPNVEKIKKVYLYNTKDNKLITYLDIVDPIQGKIPGPAEQEIRYKTFFDPAVYSVGIDGVNVDEGLNWTSNQVGHLWWNLTRAKFINNQSNDIVYRSTTWNRLYETASIDIYEWVETKYLPSEWNKLADTDKGLTAGISGQTLYGDNVYSIKKKYDSISKQFINTYYYWVKNKTVVPNVNGRTLSASDVARLISDPVSAGYSCLALTGSNSFSLVNIENHIKGKEVNLNVQYWISDNHQMNAHSQWKIISEHRDSIIPSNIESKWFHSLVGKDDADRVVPDFKLPFKKRYGVEFRPRQGMFINRVEALKQFVERVNSSMEPVLITEIRDISDLTQRDESPAADSGLWDVQIDTYSELKFIGISTIQAASLTPVVENGKIIDVNIVSAGRGYINSPKITVLGSGNGAELKAVLGNNGEIVDIIIDDSGSGYSDYDTTIHVRSFAVLINSDELVNDNWSVYSWDTVKKMWERTKSQSYDVTKFWTYVDWYAQGYNQFTMVNHVVENTYELLTTPINVGEIVKVKNIGSRGWSLFYKYADKPGSVDYTEMFNIIGRESGTIKFLDILYTFKDLSGFDLPLYDNQSYDNSASKELKIILKTIRDKILIDDLRVEYLKLFFASVRYALKEQYLVDWVFKTSFVKASHNAGDLGQHTTYTNHHLSDFENYVNEVKPYKTKVREYVSNYSSLEVAPHSVTDFDILPIINSDYEVNNIEVNYDSNGELLSSSQQINSYPWKHWYDNSKFTIKEITLVDGGSGYINPPQVNIIGGFGQGAVAKAYISSGKVVKISLINPGSGYLKAPTISITGGLSDTGVNATAIAVIENNLVRSNKVTIKFDRLSRTYVVSELNETEEFTGTGSRVQFTLKWSPTLIVSKTKVTIDDAEVLPSNYVMSSKKSSKKGYTSYYGTITFKTAPINGSVIKVVYEKDFNHIAATDRINFYYNSTTDTLGKDLAQLMSGVDYGGVNIVGLGFGNSTGWDTSPWVDAAWDSFDSNYDDYIVTASENTYSYVLPYTPAVGEMINVYVNGQRIDSETFDGSTVVGNVVMPTFVGDGDTNEIQLPTPTSNPSLVLNTGDRLIFRKSTSDGGFVSQADYDTQLQGGNFEYTTATGYEPSDINVDGDGFVTPTTSSAPEEVLPGHVADAVAIKVFQRPTGGAPKVLFKLYTGDGSTTSYSIGQYFLSERSIVVNVDNEIIDVTDYEINWQNNTVDFITAPAIGSVVGIISLGFNSGTILDISNFIASGNSSEFVTRAPWLYSNLNSIILVNGSVANYSLFRTDEAYESPELVGIRFAAVIPAGSIINAMIYLDDGTGTTQQTPSVARSEMIRADGSTTTFELVNLGPSVLPGYKLQPYESNVIVKVGQQILKPSDTLYFTMTQNKLYYKFPEYKYASNSLNPSLIRVYSGNEKLTFGVDYTFNFTTNTIKINSSYYKENKNIVILVDINYDYIINDDGNITFAQPYTDGTIIEVISFYNHEILDIIRTVDNMSTSVTLTPETPDYYEFNSKLGGRFVLARPAISESYVWVIKNGTLLLPSIDYILDEDLLTVKLTDMLISSDVIQIISFSNKVVRNAFGYMQFKDMLNRTHYKRISKAKSTRLARELLQNDTEILVDDGSVLDNPNMNMNIPGIIEINGERIEYFTKSGNVLGQLRRGTLGTGVPEIHRAGLIVLDIGSSETIPYSDVQLIENSIGDGSTGVIPVNFVPVKTDSFWYRDTIPDERNQSNEIDVFVAGVRLKKSPYSMYMGANGFPESPEGDSNFDAEFSVDGTSNSVYLTNIPDPDTKIVVVKKLGKMWNSLGTSLIDSDTEVSKFLRNTETVWPQYLVDKYQYVLSTDSRVLLETDDNQPLELD